MIYEGHGEPSISVSVGCARQRRAVPLAECAACPRCESLPIDALAEDAEVRCTGEEPPLPLRGRGFDLVEIALRTPLASVVKRDVAALGADVPIAGALAVLRGHRAEAMPVVDEHARPVGVVTRERLKTARDPAAVVGEVIAPLPIVLFEDTPLVQALPALLGDGPTFVPIVGRDGELVALLTPHDVVRWLARRAGFDG
jgi:CBS domain-containing protein